MKGLGTSKPFHTRLFTTIAESYMQGYRRIVNMGGTSSSKTYSELQLLQLIAEKRNEKKRPVSISVVSESFPHLKLGAMRDFEKILQNRGIYNEANINFTDHIYYFGDSFVEFFAADEGKATGPRRDILLLNEVNHIPLKVVRELSRRTNETIFYDFNPTEEFWIIDEVLSLPDIEVKLIKSNYLDNDHLPDSIKKEIELTAARDENFRKVHIDVQWGSYEGLIFPDWKMVDAMPDTAQRCYGLDFGFTNDPTALIDVRYHAGELWLDELCYEKGMTPEAIDQLLRVNCSRRFVTVADSSDPRTIDYLSRKGHNIEACDKGAGSITLGIELMKQQPVNITKRSINLIKERRNYRYAVTKAGLTENEPAVGQQDHAIDAARYGTARLLNTKKKALPSYSFGFNH